MADFKHRRDRGIVRFSGELNLAAAVDLVETVDLLTSVYFYDLIEIQISSLGGVSTALEHYLAAHERWRAAGVRVRMRVVDRAASAAALLLSLGDERIAEPGAALVYHFFRVCSDAPVTATAAAVLFSDLADLDDRFLARLVNRALAGGVATIAPAVDASDLPVLDRLTAALPAGAKPRPRSARGLARLLERVVRHAIRAKERTALAAIYKILCRSEVAVSPAVACLLRLIDHVGDPPASPARAASAPGLVIPEWRLLYPDAGAVPREVLTRHTLALGDTGSGKTLSVVLPVLLAALRAPRGRFAGGLVVDPKAELAPVLERAAPQRVRVLAPSQTGLNLMPGSAWSLAPQLAAGRYREAAHRIVLRALSFEPSLPTRVLVDHQAPGHTTNAEFWDREGSALLVDVIAVVLMLTDAGVPAPRRGARTPSPSAPGCAPCSIGHAVSAPSAATTCSRSQRTRLTPRSPCAPPASTSTRPSAPTCRTGGSAASCAPAPRCGAARRARRVTSSSACSRTGWSTRRVAPCSPRSSPRPARRAAPSPTPRRRACTSAASRAPPVPTRSPRIWPARSALTHRGRCWSTSPRAAATTPWWARR